MLVLARKVGEKLRVGDEIEIVVVEVRGDVVRLGISAPRGVFIYREEIYAAIQAENVSASRIQGDLSQMKNMFTRERGEE
ncbi:MAG: csrA [Bacillota bacterium]|nr:MAG: csrA [Bacillota bacterium]